MATATRSKGMRKKNPTATPRRNTRSAQSGKKKKLPASDDGDKPKKKQKKSNEQPPAGKQQPNAGMKITTHDLYKDAGSEFDAVVSQNKEAAPKPKRSGRGRRANGDKGQIASLEPGRAVGNAVQKHRKRKPNQAICSATEGSPISPEEAAVDASIKKSQKKLQEIKKTPDSVKEVNGPSRVLFPDGHSTAHTASSGKNSRAGIKPTGKKCEIKRIATHLTTEHVGRRVHIIFQERGTSESAVLKQVSTVSSSKWKVEFDDGRIELVDLGDGDDQNPWRFEEESGSNKSGSPPEGSSKDHDTEEKSKDPPSNEVAPQESSAPLDDDVAGLDSDDDAGPPTENPSKASVVSGTSASSQPEMLTVKSSTVESGLSIPPSGCESVPEVSGPREVPKAKEGVAPKSPSSTQVNPTQEPPAPTSSKEPKNPFAGVSEVIQSGTTPAKPSQHETETDFVSVRGEVYEVHDVPGDGSCLYHALLEGSFPPDISSALPEDGFALRQVISDFAFRGKFQGRELDQKTQELLRSRVMVAHEGREVLEASAKEKNTTVNASFVDSLISNKTKVNKIEYYGSTYESLMFALMFNVNVITVSNTLGGFEITESDGLVEVYKLQEIATQLYPDKGENEKHCIVLYHFLLGSVREPREMSILNHVAFLEPVDPSRKIELLSKKGLVYSNDKVHRHPPNPDNPIDVDKDDSVDSTPSIASLSEQLETQRVPDKGLTSQQGGKEQSLCGQPPLEKQVTSTDQPPEESEQPSDSAASSASAQLLGGITTTKPSNIGVIGSHPKRSSVSGPLPQEQVRKEENLSEQELQKKMSEVNVLNVGDLISFTSKRSGKVRKGVVEKLPDDGDPEKRWHIRKIGDSKFGSYNLENYYWEIRKPDKSRPEIAETGIKKKESAKKTDSVNSASAPAAMSTEPSDSAVGEEVARAEPPPTEGNPLSLEAEPPQDEITESNNTVPVVTPESSHNSELPQLSPPAKRSDPIPPAESTQPSTSNLQSTSTMDSSFRSEEDMIINSTLSPKNDQDKERATEAPLTVQQKVSGGIPALPQKQDKEQEQPTGASPAAPSTSGVENSTPENGTVEAMPSAASAPGNGSCAEQNRPEESVSATPGSGDCGSSSSLPPDQSQGSIWDQAKEVLAQRKLPKIVELFLGLVDGGGKKFYLTKKQVGVIDVVHFLEDSRESCKHVGNFQYDSSASLQEMFSMCYFLTGEGCLLEMYRELLIDEESVEDGFFKDQDNEKFKEYRDKMKNTIMSLSIMLCPGICRKKNSNQLGFRSNFDLKKKNFGDKLSEAFSSGKLFSHSSEESDSKEGTNGYKEFDPNNAGEDFLLGVEHQSSCLVDFLLMPRAVSSSLADNVCVTEAVGCVDTNHRKVNTAAMIEKESGQSSLRETWNSNDKCDRLVMGVGSTTRTSALFERKCNKLFDPSQLEKGNECGGDLSARKGKANLEGCMHFQKRKCQEVVGPSLLEAATLLLVTLGPSVVDSAKELFKFVEKEGVKDEKKVALLTGMVVSVLSRLVSEWEKRKDVEHLLVGLFVWLQEDFVGSVCEGDKRGLKIESFVEVLNGIRNVLQCCSLMVTSSIEGAKRDRLAVEELLGLNAYDDNGSFCKEMWTEKESASNFDSARLKFLTKQKIGFFDVPLFSAATPGYLEQYVLCCKKKSEMLTVGHNFVQLVPSYSKFGDFYGRLPPSMYCDGFRKLVYDLSNRTKGNAASVVALLKRDALEGSAKSKKKGKDCLAKHVVNSLHAGRCGPPEFIEYGMRTLYQVLHGSSCSASTFLELGISSEGILSVVDFLASKDLLMSRIFTGAGGKNSGSKGSYKPNRTGKKDNNYFYVESLMRSVWENVHCQDDARLMKSIFDLNGAGARTVWTPESMENMTDKEKDQSTTICGTKFNVWQVFPRTLSILFHSAGDTLKNWYPLDAVVGKTKPKAHNRLLSFVGYKLNRQMMEFVHDNGIWLCLDKTTKEYFPLLSQVCSKRFHEKMPFYVTPSGSFVNVHMPLVILLGLVKEGIVVMRTEGYDLLSNMAKKKGRAYVEFEFLMHGLVEEVEGNKGRNEEFLCGMIESGIDSCDLLQKLVPSFSFDLDNARLQEAFIRELGDRNRQKSGDKGGESALFRRLDGEREESLEDVPLVEDCADVQEYGLKCIGELLELNKNAPDLKEMLNLICRGCLDSSCKVKPEYWSLVALMSRYFDHSFPNVEEESMVYTDEERFVLYAHLLREFEETCLYQKFNYSTPNVFDIIDGLNSHFSFHHNIPKMNAFGSKGGVQKRKGEEDAFGRRLEEEIDNRVGYQNGEEFDFEAEDSEGPSLYIEDEASEVVLEDDRESRKGVDSRRECSGNSRKSKQRIMAIPLTKMDAVEEHFYKVGFNRYKKAYEAGCRLSLLEKEFVDEERERFCLPLSDWEHVQKRFNVEDENLLKYYGLGVKENDSSVRGSDGSAPKPPDNPVTPVRKSGRKRQTIVSSTKNAQQNAPKRRKLQRGRGPRKPRKEETDEEESEEEEESQEESEADDEEEEDDEKNDDDEEEEEETGAGEGEEEEEPPKAPAEEEPSKAGDGKEGSQVQSNEAAGEGYEDDEDDDEDDDDSNAPLMPDDEGDGEGSVSDDSDDGRIDMRKIILLLPRGIPNEECMYHERDFSSLCDLVEEWTKEEVEKELSLLVESFYKGGKHHVRDTKEVELFYCYLRIKKDVFDNLPLKNLPHNGHCTVENAVVYKKELSQLQKDAWHCISVVKERDRIMKKKNASNGGCGKLSLHLPRGFKDEWDDYSQRNFHVLAFKVSAMSWEDCYNEICLATEYSFVYGLEKLSKNEDFQCFYSNLEKRTAYFDNGEGNSDVAYGRKAMDEFKTAFENFVTASGRYREFCRKMQSVVSDDSVLEGKPVMKALFPFRIEFVGEGVVTEEVIPPEVPREVTQGTNALSSVVRPVPDERAVDSVMPEPILLLPRGFSESDCSYPEQDFGALCGLVAARPKEEVQKELSVLVEYCYKGSMELLIENKDFVRFYSYLRIRQDVLETDSAECPSHNGICSIENEGLFKGDLLQLAKDGQSCRDFLGSRDEKIEKLSRKGVEPGKLGLQALGGGFKDEWQNYTKRDFGYLSFKIPDMGFEDCLQEIRLLIEYSYVFGLEELRKNYLFQSFYSNLMNRTSTHKSANGECMFEYGILARSEYEDDFENLVTASRRYREFCISMKEAVTVDSDLVGRSLADCVFPAKLEFVEETGIASGKGSIVEESTESKSSSNGVGETADRSCLAASVSENDLKTASPSESPESGVVERSQSAVPVTQDENPDDSESVKDIDKTESPVRVRVGNDRGLSGNTEKKTPSSVAIVGNREGSDEDNMFLEFLGKIHGSVYTEFGGKGNDLSLNGDTKRQLSERSDDGGEAFSKREDGDGLVMVQREQEMQGLFVDSFLNSENRTGVKEKYKALYEDFCQLKKKSEEAAKEGFMKCLSTQSEDVVSPDQDAPPELLMLCEFSHGSVEKKAKEYVDSFTDSLKK